MSSSEYVHCAHNVSNLVYHFVYPAKYRRVVIDPTIDEAIKQICVGIELRYEWIEFLEIGTDKDHVHFLIQSTPEHSPSEIIRTVTSLTARRIFAEHPEVKKQLWGGEFWNDGYFVSTVGKNVNENTIREYVKNQGTQDSYKQLYFKM
ncbi:MAG: IS200/IS605 family transposase [Solobacterium sp.]|jgi:REP element-mobilizing transposase RayT|nr:IS200/IS605 family transposase [Solobacterium sp.]MCH4013375.1 IS200/IS605 family transposase [Solobacterium sp.]MCH4013410.1 IS200/IS605 family transposase [Solobacterium sp.]MCH4014119.1 IS200/IS605 family transposase [Solobacterium sp.]MCH4014560.1 IS200/IS605 family transposase [Solobacterium sp.]